jgi:hypothetical protein
MINYDIALKDFSFYWEGTFILTKHEEYGYMPASFLDIAYAGDDCRNTPHYDCDPETRARLLIREDIVRAKVGRAGKEILVTTSPSNLFDNNEEFITYRPFGGVVAFDDGLYYLEGGAPRSRYKGIRVSEGRRAASYRVITMVEPTSPKLTVGTLGVLGLCARLDSSPAFTKEQVDAVIAGDEHFAVHGANLSMIRSRHGAGCYIGCDKVADISRTSDGYSFNSLVGNDYGISLFEEALSHV